MRRSLLLLLFCAAPLVAQDSMVCAPVIYTKQITAWPDSVMLHPGDTISFGSYRTMSDGSNRPGNAAWTTSGGTVSTTGAYKAGIVEGRYRVVATADKAADTVWAVVRARIIVPPPPPPGNFPHQPVGYTPFMRYTGSVLPVASVGGGAQGGANGAIWRYEQPYAPGTMSVVSDASAPGSPPGVFRLAFPNGLFVGAGPGIIQAWATGDEHSSTEYSEIYESSWIKIGDNGFQTQGVLVKILGYWGVGQRGEDATPAQVLGFIAGNGTTAILSSWNLAFIQQNYIDRRLEQNVGSIRLVSGKWQHIELVMRVNNPTSASNGVLQVWIDGSLTHSYNNVQFRTPQHPSGFYARRWDPIWGGMGGGNRTRTDYLYIDDLYLSGKR